jgi:hypothetical protein
MNLESPQAELVRNLVQALSLTYDQVILHLAMGTRADLYNVILQHTGVSPNVWHDV